MTPKPRFVNRMYEKLFLNYTKTKVKISMSTLRWVSRVIWLLFFAVVGYTSYSYVEMTKVKQQADQVIKLHNAAQQLRQIVSTSMFKQQDQLVHLENEIKHFRYLLLRTKNISIQQKWVEIHPVLFDADAFVEDVDNLLASVYSISSVTRHLSALLDSQHSIELERLVESISTYFFFEFYGVNSGSKDNAVRFNLFVKRIEKMLSVITSDTLRIDIYTLYTSLVRINDQLKRLDGIIEHPFIQTITQEQGLWTSRVLTLVDRVIYTLPFSFFLLMLQIMLNRGSVSLRYQQKQMTSENPIAFSSAQYSRDSDMLFDFSDKIFDSSVLDEQLEGCPEAIDAVLTMFVVEHKNDAIVIKKLINNDELDEAKMAVHTLKGVAGNVGATALEEICRFIESHLRSGLKVEDHWIHTLEKSLHLTVQRVIKEIEHMRHAPVT